MKSIVDTGPLVAYFCASDQYHAWSVAVLNTRERPLLTVDAADFRLYRRQDRTVIPFIAPPPPR